MLRTGFDNAGALSLADMGGGVLDLPPLDFDEAACTFTAGMAKRSTGIFAAAPIVQGDLDGAGAGDSLSYPRGALVSGLWYGNFDPYQGSAVAWWTPECDDATGAYEYLWFQSGNYFLCYERTAGLFRLTAGGQNFTVAHAPVSGTRICLIARWNCNNTLDGTNYASLSVNGVHTYGVTTQPTSAAPDTAYIGAGVGPAGPCNGIVEGLTIYRRPLWDGDYGVDVGNGDEVALISAGVDPCTVTGSWDVCFCCPTNAAVGALVTGTGEAWSHPHAAAEANLTDAFCQTAYAASAWADEGTPVTPAAYLFGAATLINCGSNAALDDLHDAAFTAEAWVRADGWGTGLIRIFSKDAGGVGWRLFATSADGLRATIVCATTSGDAESGPDDFIPDGRLHHVAMTWDDATYNYPRLWVDGLEVSYADTTNRVGLIVSDASVNFIIGNRSATGQPFDGKIAWCRLSNTIRYNSPFVPPPLTNPPAVDGNTVEQWNFTDCAGASVTASVNPGAPPAGCDGQITAGAGGWNCLKDMDDFAVGDRAFQWGYVFGSDAANEGITQTIAGLDAGQDYVLRVPVNLGADSNGRARIRVRDETNAANIVDFDGPLMTGAHTGANNSATLIVAGARFPQSLIGAEVYNITDVNVAGTGCSHAAITAISGDGTTVTAALAGGTDNDWDTNDVFRIVWHRTAHGVRSMPADVPWTEPFTFELPTIARHGVGADCVSISVKVLNSLTAGTVMCHQVELQENLVDNPSLETPIPGANPWIPDGWTNDGLDPGDSQRSSTGGNVIHSGADCIQMNAGAGVDERVYVAVALPQDGFGGIGCWAHTDGRLDGYSGVRVIDQTTLATVFIALQSGTAVWEHLVGVGRGGATARQLALDGQAAQHYVDDVYCIELDDVTLTAAAANQADSAEATGLRVDGRDTCVQPVPAGYWATVSGWTRWRWTARHDAAQLAAFDEAGNEATLLQAWGNATNYIRVHATAANNIRLEFNDGGGAHQANWNCAGQVVAATTYLMEIRYTATDMWLTQDGAERARITTPLAFATVPTNVYWGSRQAGDLQVDATYNEP